MRNFIIILSIVLISLYNTAEIYAQDSAGLQSVYIPAPDEFIELERDPDCNIKELQSTIVYPESARKSNLEGKVIIRVLVNPEGRPVKYIVDSSLDPDTDSAAAKAIMSIDYKPAIQKGRAIYCWVSIPVSFKLRDNNSKTIASSPFTIQDLQDFPIVSYDTVALRKKIREQLEERISGIVIAVVRVSPSGDILSQKIILNTCKNTSVDTLVTKSLAEIQYVPAINSDGVPRPSKAYVKIVFPLPQN